MPIREASTNGPAITLELDESLAAKLGTEGYRLSVGSPGVRIRAAAFRYIGWSGGPPSGEVS